MFTAHQGTLTSQNLRRQLDELRSKIELLPEERRPTLRAYAHRAEQQHKRMQRDCASVRDAVDDLRLIVAYTKFHVEACRLEAVQARREHGTE